MLRKTTNRSLLVAFMVLYASSLAGGIFIQFSSSLNHSKNAFRIPFDNLEVDSSELTNALPPNMGINLRYYKNLSKVPTDERCSTGKPLGAAVFQYSPYANAQYFKDPKTRKTGFTFYGIFPAVIRKALSVCCHPNSSIEFAKLLDTPEVAANATTSSDYDFHFPLYGDGMDATSYRDNPFIPIIEAPRVALLVHNDNSKEGKPGLIITTILKTWPMLVFILLMAGSSGIIIWFLDHTVNSDHFSKPFMNGAWEGFWWAFITMTTVGYGDRCPRSYLGRLFSILWIVFGVVIISIFTGLTTTALTASTRSSFTIHGSKIGAVSGSKEFKLGIDLNADMKAFKSPFGYFSALMGKKVDGVMVDNYVAVYFSKEIIKRSFRVDQMIKHPITYGVMLGKNASKLERCLRKFILDNPQEVFEIISHNLHLLKNPADKVNLQLKEADKLFYQNETFRKILWCFLGALLMLGISSQLFIYCWRKRGKQNSGKFNHQVIKDVRWNRGSSQGVEGSLNDLIEQYNCFQDGWMNRLKSIHNE